MRQDKEEWVVSLDGENYNGYITYPAKEAAIEAGRREFTNVKNGQYSEVFDGYIGDDKFFFLYLQNFITIFKILFRSGFSIHCYCMKNLLHSNYLKKLWRQASMLTLSRLHQFDYTILHSLF